MVGKIISRVMAAGLTAAVAYPALADDTGFAYMHTLSKERGRTCFADHWHFGSGSGPTRKKAEIEAIKSWSDFTALEYGSDWARFSRAGGKSIKCMPTGGGMYDCQIDARPCK